MMALTRSSDHVQASDSHVTTASGNSKSMLQQEIGEQVLGIFGGNIQSPTVEETVIKDGQVLDPTNEHYAPDLSMNCSNTSSPQNSPVHTQSLTPDDASTAGYSNTGRGTHVSESSADESIYECKVCRKRLQQRDEFKVHLQSHLSRTSKIWMKEVRNLSYYMRQHSEDKPYSCNIYDKNFGFSGAFASHIMSHLDHKISRIRNKTRKETDKCAKNDHLCSPQYTSVSSYSYQNCFGRLQCLSCCKSFPSRHQLQNHAVYHSEPRFKCLICDIAFYHKYQLQLHQISHTGLPRHVCSWCNKSFLFSFSLRMHMRIHTSVRLLRRMEYLKKKMTE